MTNLGYAQSLPTVVYEDNKACIVWSESPTGSEQARHIDLSKHFVHEKVSEGHLALIKVDGQDQVVDIITKSQEYLLLVKHCAAVMGF